VQAVDLGEHALRVAEDHAALGGELDAAARAAEDLDAELLLEAPDLLGDRRLGEVQLLGGLRERAVAGDGGDGAKVAQLHAPMVPGRRREVEVSLLRPAISRRDGIERRRFASAGRPLSLPRMATQDDGTRGRILRVGQVSGSSWTVSVDDDPTPLSEHRTRSEAEAAARSHAEMFGYPEILVYDNEGTRTIIIDDATRCPAPRRGRRRAPRADATAGSASRRARAPSRR
jgi:hypothetical protein